MNTFDFVVMTNRMDEILEKLLILVFEESKETGMGLKFADVDKFRREYFDYLSALPDTPDTQYLGHVAHLVFDLMFVLSSNRKEFKKDHLE